LNKIHRRGHRERREFKDIVISNGMRNLSGGREISRNPSTPLGTARNDTSIRLSASPSAGSLPAAHTMPARICRPSAYPLPHPLAVSAPSAVKKLLFHNPARLLAHKMLQIMRTERVVPRRAAALPPAKRIILRPRARRCPRASVRIRHTRLNIVIKIFDLARVLRINPRRQSELDIIC